MKLSWPWLCSKSGVLCPHYDFFEVTKKLQPACILLAQQFLFTSFSYTCTSCCFPGVCTLPDLYTIRMITLN